MKITEELMRVLFTVLIGLLAQVHLQASEPAYCSPASFKSFEIDSPAAKVERLHAFQMGHVYLAGLAVGNSKVSEVKKMASHYSNASAQDKYCTWYFNDGNSEAEKTFNWKDLPKPTSDKVINEWTSKVLPIFHDNAVNFVGCAERQKYIALGCQGQKHRGPTVFGMLLAYSGCSPKNAVAIANSLWGSNGIPTSVREKLAQKAYELGQKFPQNSQRLQQALTN
jgi:hypothetical protein